MISRDIMFGGLDPSIMYKYTGHGDGLGFTEMMPRHYQALAQRYRDMRNPAALHAVHDTPIAIYGRVHDNAAMHARQTNNDVLGRVAAGNIAHPVQSPVNSVAFGGSPRGTSMSQTDLAVIMQMLGRGGTRVSAPMTGRVNRAPQRTYRDAQALEASRLQQQIAAEEAAYRAKYGNVI